MKLGPVTKIEKRNKAKSKKIEDDGVSEIVTSLLFF